MALLDNVMVLDKIDANCSAISFFDANYHCITPRDQLCFSLEPGFVPRNDGCLTEANFNNLLPSLTTKAHPHIVTASMIAITDELNPKNFCVLTEVFCSSM